MLSVVLLLTVGVQVALGWGGLFNRFSPEMLSNLGYGGHGSSSYRVQPFLQNSNSMEALQELQEASDPCFGRKCMANEHCCPSFVCIIRDQDVGSCFPLDGLGQGELCRHHSDCDTGLICYSNGDGTKTCQPPFASPKLYKECTISNECDIHRGLCCQYQRRHRQAARKVCSYFKDPLVCIGPVASDQVKGDIERTAGEKRITSKSLDAFNHLRR
ncbi:prohormone-3 isoform X2 [Cimex lectularius]|uniref:Prohormone-3 n=1 Tax=Cimex lectularius TaxID=79782 RepID=A0A8I6S0S0_CIMLE|nr:prohormone-3 isoform X2 [Cimex lectularius]